MSGYQKKRTKNGRIIMAVCGVLLLLYLGGQLWGFANIKLRTEQVEEDTLYDFVRTEGLVFRSEEVISKATSGVMVYNCADGEEVAMDQEVAAVYKDSTVSMVNNQLDQLRQELASLNKAQTVKATRYSAVANLSNQINDQAGKIVDFAAGRHGGRHRRTRRRSLTSPAQPQKDCAGAGGILLRAHCRAECPDCVSGKDQGKAARRFHRRTQGRIFL